MITWPLRVLLWLMVWLLSFLIGDQSTFWIIHPIVRIHKAIHCRLLNRRLNKNWNIICNTDDGIYINNKITFQFIPWASHICRVPDKPFPSWEVLTASKVDMLLDRIVINLWKTGCCTNSIGMMAPSNKSSNACYGKSFLHHAVHHC